MNAEEGTEYSVEHNLRGFAFRAACVNVTARLLEYDILLFTPPPIKLLTAHYYCFWNGKK